MGAVLSALLAAFATLFRSHLALQLEIVAVVSRYSVDAHGLLLKQDRAQPARLYG